jgi:hypothetical protein
MLEIVIIWVKRMLLKVAWYSERAKDFSFSLCVQTSSEAHPVSYSMSTGGPLLGRKARPGRDAEHSPPSSTEVKIVYELYSSPLSACSAVAGRLYSHVVGNCQLLKTGCGGCIMSCLPSSFHQISWALNLICWFKVCVMLCSTFLCFMVFVLFSTFQTTQACEIIIFFCGKRFNRWTNLIFACWVRIYFPFFRIT